MTVLESPNSARNTSRHIPPLENGDRLSRGEFERRYSAMPGVKKAELIERVVYMPSPVQHRLHAKLNVYRRNGVREYLVWQSDTATAQWFTLIEGKYEPLRPGDDGLLKSRLFPGLWLDAAALGRGDLPRLLAVLDQGTSCPEHAAFIERLKQ